MRRLGFIAGLVLLVGCRGWGQVAAMAADADPAFEVATIRVSDPEAKGRALDLGGRTFKARNFSFDELAVFGFGIQKKQLVGGVEWMDTVRFDVSGVPDNPGQPSNGQWRVMVRKLLEERFQMVAHHEQRELDVFRIGVAKGGLKMTVNTSGKPGPGSFHIQFTKEGIRVASTNESMAELVQTMALTMVDRPVLDGTGLTGRYDFSFMFAQDGMQMNGMKMPAPGEGGMAPSLATALREEMGLRMEAVKAAMDVVVVDRAERVSGN